MQFEWDESKSGANNERHGIDFEEACELWEDRNRIEFRLNHSGGQRKATIARYGGTLWFAVFTMRNGSIRIISVRRAVGKEVSLYDRTNSNS